jgi:hypothetical protein
MEDKEKTTNLTLIGVNVTENNIKQLDEITAELYGYDAERMQSSTVRYCINYAHKRMFEGSND